VFVQDVNVGTTASYHHTIELTIDHDAVMEEVPVNRSPVFIVSETIRLLSAESSGISIVIA
jgi:hypothetical protein